VSTGNYLVVIHLRYWYEFNDYTVIAFSHRLEMIMDFDWLVVMDTGAIVEVGNPATLAQEAVTRFGDLVRAGNKKA
jgi:ABC-type multidrug transport system fused ATPase/permease subunit